MGRCFGQGVRHPGASPRDEEDTDEFDLAAGRGRHGPGSGHVGRAWASPGPAGAAGVEDDSAEAKIRDSVVKISATMRVPDLTKPWTKQSPAEASGTGVVIEGKRILTNAHVVLYASQLFVEGNQSSEKLPAKVVAVSPGIDLAVLRLEDESFFDKRPPLPRTAALPEVKETVLVYGYPQGGSTLSITKGIVSRIEFTGYNERRLGRARAGRRRDQPGQQRRPGPDRRQDDRR